MLIQATEQHESLPELTTAPPRTVVTAGTVQASFLTPCFLNQTVHQIGAPVSFLLTDSKESAVCKSTPMTTTWKRQRWDVNGEVKGWGVG